MVQFLSEAWFDEYARVAAQVPVSSLVEDGLAPMTMRQIVTGTPGGDLRYDLRLDRSGVSVVHSPSADPDVSFEQDQATARRLARGDGHPQIELTEGRLQISGSANRLVPWRPVLDALHDALGDLRASTTW